MRAWLQSLVDGVSKMGIGTVIFLIFLVLKLAEIDPSFTLKMLSHCLCATLAMEVFNLGFGRASVYFKDKDVWIGGSYMFSVDFTTGNELLHLMRLDNGLFAFVPNHKVNWAGKCALTDYKKNHSVWTF